jgi:SAM-dependent methyltransferase
VAYYDGIARRWDAVTGAGGGAFKRHVLNDRLLGIIDGIRPLSVLELGAGNGYFSRLLSARWRCERLVVTDASPELIDLARQRHPARGAEYRVLDIGEPFPFDAHSFTLLLATMVFNEVRSSDLSRALLECRRILAPGGRLVATVLHPRFVHSLSRRGQLRPARGERGPLTMPGAKGLRLPVVRRTLEEYEALFRQAGFGFEVQEIIPSPKVLLEKRGAAGSGKIPWALLFDARGA